MKDILTPESPAPAIDLLLAYADDYAPVFPEPVCLSALAQVSRFEHSREILGREEAGNIGAAEKDPNSLADQRWGVVLPEGAQGERLRAALKELLAHRQSQQREEVRVFTLPAALDEAGAERWIRDVYLDPDSDEEERPFYLLLAGDLQAVPLPLQLSLATATEAFVGRVAFPRLEDYEAYVHKLVRCEREAKAHDATGLFFSARDPSLAVRVGETSLLSPCLATLNRKQEEGRLVAALRRIANQDAGALLAAARAAPPALLFTVSHGLGPPRGGWSSSVLQRLRQGALVCGTNPAETLSATEAASGPFLPNGLWLMFACFGAGTPQRSTYAPWLEALRQSGHYSGPAAAALRGLPAPGEPPFLAALPQAALANPDGPLAVIAHIDMAWTFSFQELGSKRPARAARFSEAARMLLNGSRVGVALRKIHKDIARYQASLIDVPASLAEAPQAEGVWRAWLRLQREDLRYFIVLGDPAARLPSTFSHGG